MAAQDLESTARALVADNKGILAADESDGTIKKRFDSIDAESTEENRRAYRDLLFTTEGAEEFISGVILFDETIRQSSSDGTPFPQLLERRGIIPGIKVDKGAKPLTNAPALARYAALSQEAGLVPIVEPEVLMDGEHSIERSFHDTSRVLHAVFTELRDQRVHFEGMLLKPNMVLSGYSAPQQASHDEVAEQTLRCFRRHVPAAVPGIVFLSGGQTDEDATANLNALNARGPHPWELSFSYGRALQAPALKAWGGEAANVDAAKKAFYRRAKFNGAARSGSYAPEMEREAAVA